jgi:hypothetical protein
MSFEYADPLGQPSANIVVPGTLQSITPSRAAILAANAFIREPLDALAQEEERLSAELDGLHLARERARERRLDAEGSRAQLFNDYDGKPPKDQVEVIDAQIASARNAHEAIAARPQILIKRREALLGLLSGATKLMDALEPGKKFERVTAKATGATPGQVDAARDDVFAILAEREEIEHARPPADHVIAIATKQLDGIAQGFDVELVNIGRRNGPPIYQTVLRSPQAMVNAVSISENSIPTVSDAAARQVGDNLIAEVVSRDGKRVQALYSTGPIAMDAAEKAKRLAEVNRKLEAAERIEAATVWAAREAGHDVAWRQGISIKAVLGIK